MDLVIDIGNTRSKVAVFASKNCLEVKAYDSHSLVDGVRGILSEFKLIDRAIVSTVGDEPEGLVEVLDSLKEVVWVDEHTQLMFENDYQSKETLGADRKALMAAAYRNHPGKNVLVIDLGSCITYDLLEGGERYVGGAISPGWRMRVEAMHEFTSKLPSLQPSEPMTVLGDTTTSCMQIGAYNGVVGELQELIKAYRKRFEDLTVILTGGDAEIFGKRLKNCIFAHSNFLLEGLHELLEYNSIW
ncbi:MAG: type III pantothenate kinase [Flavobacteriaceae bacterium]